MELKMNALSRRSFLKRMVAGATAMTLSGCSQVIGFDPDLTATGSNAPMKLRALGNTGTQVSLLGLGGEALVQENNPDAITLLEHAIDDLGITYLDTSRFYNGGQSERNIGQVIGGSRRRNVFLATKSHARTYDGVMAHVDESLEALNTDYIDLYQAHDVRANWHVDNGAVRAMEKLRDRGVIRHIGITGHHDPRVLLRAIERHPFDVLLMSLNPGDRWYWPFQTDLLDAALQREMGIVVMKVTAKDRLVRPDRLTMTQALNYVYSFPISCAVVGIDEMWQLEEDALIANQFSDPLSEEELEELENSVQPYETDANWFKMGYEEV